MQSATKTHCCNNAADRALGAHWERRFCALAAQHQRSFTPLQIGRATAASWYTHDGRQWLLPDVTIWTCPSEHHEIKHKNPTRGGCFGLEKYRLDALLAFQAESQHRVLYTIHNWELAGAATGDTPIPNKLEHWVTVDVLRLEQYITARRAKPVAMDTYVNGQKKNCPGYYWPANLWIPLAQWWSPFDDDDDIPF